MPPQTHIDLIAVLPLENLSRDPDQEYFADGMTEALITDLGKVSALRVVSRTSMMHYKGTRKTLPEIARELDVDGIVEGSVQRSGSRVRITAQLIQAVDDRHLWAETYERDLHNVLALQGEVARAITNEIQIKLTPQEHTRLSSARRVNPEAYEAYLKGRYYLVKWTDEGSKLAIEYFQQAINKDPKCAVAYASLAEVYVTNSPLPRKDSVASAKAAATKALELDDTLGEAHTPLAIIRYQYDWDWTGAGEEFKRAIALNPNDTETHHQYSHYWMGMGRTEESYAESKRSLELDPLLPAINLHLGFHYLFARQYDQAIQQLQKTLQMDPNSPEALGWLGYAYEQKRMYPEALAAFGKAIAISGGISSYRASLAHTYAVSGKRREAQKLLDELSKEGYSPLSIAEVETALGHKDKAFEWLERAYRQRDSDLAEFFKMNPRFDSLRSDPRFQDLLRRMNFPP